MQEEEPVVGGPWFSCRQYLPLSAGWGGPQMEKAGGENIFFFSSLGGGFWWAKVLFGGHLCPCLRFLLKSSVGLKARAGSRIHILAKAYTCVISSLRLNSAVTPAGLLKTTWTTTKSFCFYKTCVYSDTAIAELPNHLYVWMLLVHTKSWVAIGNQI